MEEKKQKKRIKVNRKSLGTIIGLSIATILGLVFWRKKNSY